MSAAELRVARESLGLTGDHFAALLRVNPRTARAWEQGRAGYRIPEETARDVRRIEAETGRYVEMLAAQYADKPDPVLTVYRTDDDYEAADPASPYSAAWHRALAARVARRVPALRIVYYPEYLDEQPPTLTPYLMAQLLDVLHGTFIDAVALADPYAFLTGEIEDCLDDATEETAYPELLAEARTWSRSQAAAVLAEARARLGRQG